MNQTETKGVISRYDVAFERDHFRDMQALHQAGTDKHGTTLVGFHDAGLALAYGLCADKLDLLLAEDTRPDAERRTS